MDYDYHPPVADGLASIRGSDAPSFCWIRLLSCDGSLRGEEGIAQVERSFLEAQESGRPSVVGRLKVELMKICHKRRPVDHLVLRVIRPHC